MAYIDNDCISSNHRVVTNGNTSHAVKLTTCANEDTVTNLNIISI